MPEAVLRGIFPVLQTPVRADGELDPASLKREVSFAIEAGAHGLVFPVLASEFQYLTEEERQRLVETVIGEASNRVPVVAGVAGTTKAEAVVHARHAGKVGADAVIALPPSPGTAAELKEYYEAIAQAADLPVFIQHSQPGMDTAFLREMLEEVELVQYVKEEMHPSAHNIGALCASVGKGCLGVFGGGNGRWMLSELRRGATGFMPATEVVDVHVQIWDAAQAGDDARARDLFDALLPLLNLVVILGIPVCKEALVRRGVFATAGMRTPGSLALDAEDHHELEIVLYRLSSLFRV